MPRGTEALTKEDPATGSWEIGLTFLGLQSKTVKDWKDSDGLHTTSPQVQKAVMSHVDAVGIIMTYEIIQLTNKTHEVF